MRPIFETCERRPEALQGELREDSFAARLRDVLEGRAEDPSGGGGNEGAFVMPPEPPAVTRQD